MAVRELQYLVSPEEQVLGIETVDEPIQPGYQQRLQVGGGGFDEVGLRVPDRF